MNVTPTQLSTADCAELERLLAGDLAFIDHEALHHPDAERRLFIDAPAIPEADTAWITRSLFTRSIGRHAARPKLARFMTREEEGLAFLQFNFARMNAARCRAAIIAGDAGDAMAGELLRWHRLAAQVRNGIVGHHLPFVLHLAKGWNVAGCQFDDIIAEGFRMVVELAGRFDCAGGPRFMAAVNASVPGAFHHLNDKSARYQRSFSAPFKASLMGCTDHRGEQREERRQQVVEELRAILAGNVARLTRDELRILNAHYRGPVARQGGDRFGLCPVYLIAKRLRMWTDRVKRLLGSAMQKLRAALDCALHRRAALCKALGIQHDQLAINGDNES